MEIDHCVNFEYNAKQTNEMWFTNLRYSANTDFRQIEVYVQTKCNYYGKESWKTITTLI